MEPIIRDRKTGERLDPHSLTHPQPVLVDFLYEGRDLEGVEGTVTAIEADSERTILRIMLHHKKLMDPGVYTYYAPLPTT